VEVHGDDGGAVDWNRAFSLKIGFRRHNTGRFVGEMEDQSLEIRTKNTEREKTRHQG